MITPQKELYNISRRIDSLEEKLDNSVLNRRRSIYCLQDAHPEDEYSIFERVEHLEEEIDKIDAMQAQLTLIIKLLGKQ